ncbi:long chronological lifespan protein 2 [Scheffersomyces coipomensis]|uniref:long chronological lifespan protein 2 n=1 Tax=Scheffersomyces coipomensis TaxID=1788519 RepID=UPI00315D4733
MISIILTCIIFISSFVNGNLFDFLQNFGGQQGGHQQQFHEGQYVNPQDYENAKLNTRCRNYLCEDTGICVKEPKFCPCPYPSSQLRCFLPDGKYLCISKPADDSGKYDDPTTNFKVDAKDDNVRDCGWVSRAYRGLV